MAIPIQSGRATRKTTTDARKSCLVAENKPLALNGPFGFLPGLVSRFIFDSMCFVVVFNTPDNAPN
jgi:hypothetical protein